MAQSYLATHPTLEAHSVVRPGKRSNVQPRAGELGSPVGVIIHGAMDKCREALSLTFDWARHQQELLNIVFPAMQEIASCLIDDRKPTREQVDKWGALLPQLTRRMQELTVDAESVRQAIAPVLLRFDA
jgi:hypothetical protein